MIAPIERTIVVHAPPERVWSALTERDRMREWMGEPGMSVSVETDWTVGGPIVVRGFHHAPFVNRGIVERFEPPSWLRYTQASSISRLPDVPESASIIEMRLTPIAGGTSLTLRLERFPTDTIAKHLDFYWRVTLDVLRQYVEREAV